MTSRHLVKGVLGALLLLLGFAAGYYFRTFSPAPRSSSGNFRESRAPGYRFINPLLECDYSEDAEPIRELLPFRDKVEDVVNSCVREGLANNVSVYFRDLNNGPWFSINPTDKFAPASLLKVPVMITLLRHAEQNPAFLRQVIHVPKDYPVEWGQTFAPREQLVPGNSYTVEELVRRMVAYSDNAATSLLSKLITPEQENRTFRELGDVTEDENGEDFISVVTYASYFRVLYNASYLNRQYSELAMSYLSEADFPGGIRAATPMDIRVAQKFGHWKLPPGSPSREHLHDCGVVYYGKRPYLLCVMTRGDDAVKLDATIRRVASEVLRQVKIQQIFYDNS